mgnify:CR=1 FL=1
MTTTSCSTFWKKQDMLSADESMSKTVPLELPTTKLHDNKTQKDTGYQSGVFLYPTSLCHRDFTTAHLVLFTPTQTF